MPYAAYVIFLIVRSLQFTMMHNLPLLINAGGNISIENHL
jgi:hypothetical protein